MGDTRVKPNMVELGVQFGSKATLKDYLNSDSILPISLFYNSSIKQAIASAISYITDKRGGSVFIPASYGDKEVQISASISRSNHVQINYSISNYRYPINSESRPYSEDDWKVGDIVYNTDIVTNPNIGWVCVEEGTPGRWRTFGFTGKWPTDIEEIDRLPDPSAMQVNRQLVHNGRVYICKLVDGKYDWYWMDYAYGKTADRPTTDLRVGLPYFNTETGLPEWWDGTKWVEVAINDPDWVERMYLSLFDNIEEEFYKVFNIDPDKPKDPEFEKVIVEEFRSVFDEDFSIDYTTLDTNSRILDSFRMVFKEGTGVIVSSNESDAVEEYIVVFDVRLNDAMNSEEVLNATRTQWDGSSSPDPTAMSREDVDTAVHTPYNGETSEDETALSSQQVLEATIGSR